jgi:hypothetical protein
VQRLSVFRVYHERLMDMNKLLEPQPDAGAPEPPAAAHAAAHAAPAAREADDARCAS